MEKHGGKILIMLAAFFLGLLAFSGGYLLRDYDILPVSFQDDECGTLATDRAFFEVLNQLMENHITQPSREDLIYGAIEGMIVSLDDPYTTYFDLEEAEAYSQNFSETYVGIGVTIKYDHNYIYIEDIEKEGPSYDVGLRINDVITHVDGQEVFDLPLYETIGMILGEVGTEVVIGVYREGYQQTLIFPIIRQVIDNSSVEYESYLEGDQLIGYIKVNTFGDQTFPLFAEAVMALEEAGIDSLIIDLRDNGGGHLLTVFYMMNLFLVDDGTAIFRTEYYSNGVHYFKSYVASNTIKKDYNIVTLINENSASASEVFASGMQEHGGYTLVGETSFGKGTMQTDKMISATIGDQLHITIGKWTTSDGSWVHYNGGTDGITPDIVVEKQAIEMAYKVFLLDGDPIVYDTVDERLENIQIVLNMMGYSVRTDGYFDLETRDAIMEIQTNNGLTINGDINSETLNVLNTELHFYQFNSDNDTQLQAALAYLRVNPFPSVE